MNSWYYVEYQLQLLCVKNNDRIEYFMLSNVMLFRIFDKSGNPFLTKYSILIHLLFKRELPNRLKLIEIIPYQTGP
jgi:hypothetical protein